CRWSPQCCALVPRPLPPAWRSEVTILDDELSSLPAATTIIDDALWGDNDARAEAIRLEFDYRGPAELHRENLLQELESQSARCRRRRHGAAGFLPFHDVLVGGRALERPPMYLDAALGLPQSSELFRIGFEFM